MNTVILAGVVLSAIISLPAAYGQSGSLNIIYTGSMNGKLEPCGCSPKTDYGGVARLAGYIARHGRELSPYLLIDAGNFTARDTPQGRLQAEAMLRSFRIMKYDAVALLSNEKAFAEDFLPSLIRRYDIPAVSDSPPYDTSVLVKKDGFAVNISTNPKDYRKDALNIFLTDIPVSGSAATGSWDIIISSSGEIREKPLKTNGTIIVSGYPEGKRPGLLRLQVDAKGDITGFRHEWLLLGGDSEENADVRNVLDDYDSGVAGLLKESGKPPGGTAYLGVAKCAECHQPFVESWGKTRHARAFASLRQAGKGADPECIACHTVGFGEKGGFYTIETTPELANVQCEECHGPDREHIEDFSRPMKPVSESVCLKCHKKDNSPDFDYERYLEKIRH